MDAQVSARGLRALGLAVAAVTLVVAGPVAHSGPVEPGKPGKQAPSAVAAVTASANVAQAYELRPPGKPDRTCRYPYQVLETGERLVWVQDASPFVAPPDVRGVWLLVSPTTNTYMWFVSAMYPHTVMDASANNNAGAWFEVPARAVTWCGTGRPPAHAPR
ncbi:hypothetical protein [Nocardia sp. NRRL S-836]|uniref:hypothetical protein n=1 Tax=Nocardia sp. NRRL S-836 TaxID=1519492 RepID=UPI0006AE410B|nr:hypothetical protein [Nocardia sp. NRRL S-836]KOV84750.1 hypothetical protein ADL03_15920 [Nocardia sp. NRRL S-836]